MYYVIIIIKSEVKMSLLSKNIAYFRRKKGMTQKELAEKSGLSKSFISQIENNNNNPSKDSLYKISKVLNVSMENLTGEYITEDTQILKLLINLTESGKVNWKRISDPSTLYDYIYYTDIKETRYEIYETLTYDKKTLIDTTHLEIRDNQDGYISKITMDSLDNHIYLKDLIKIIRSSIKDNDPKYNIINDLENLLDGE